MLSNVPVPSPVIAAAIGIQPDFQQALARSEPERLPGSELDWSVEPLQGWHIPLLDDPAFQPLQPLLQRALLLGVPDRLIAAVSSRRCLAPRVHVALCRDQNGRPMLLGIIITRRLNRSGSSWEVQHLMLAQDSLGAPGLPTEAALNGALLREAILRGRGACSWIATTSSLDIPRLAALRQQGFQPLRRDVLWCWQAKGPAPALGPGLELLPLNRDTAPQLWHLEQAAIPAQLRQILDRRSEDLLDHSGTRGWMLVDAIRREAVAGVRWLADQPEGGQLIELSVMPGHEALLGPPTALLLHHMSRPGQPLWMRVELSDQMRNLWIEQLGATGHGEQVLMGRSVWRRQPPTPAREAARRLEAMLEPFQPRRRTLPTPVGPR